MQNLSGREKSLLSILVILAILVLVGGRRPEPAGDGLWWHTLALVVAALHDGPYADLAAFIGGVVAVVALAVSTLGRNPAHPVPAVAVVETLPGIQLPSANPWRESAGPTPPGPYASSRFAFRHHAEHFLGRETELGWLDAAWAQGLHVLAIIAWGGVGKTALLAEWLHTRFFDRNFADPDGSPAPAAYFDWSFYDQGSAPTADPTAARVGSVGDFFEQALAHFGDPDPTRPGKGRRLAQLVQAQRTLFVIDGLEPLQHPPGSPQAGRLLDPDLGDLIQALAQVNPGLLLITSRQPLPDLDGLRGGSCQRDLEDLAPETAVRLLRELEVQGTDTEVAAACERFGCHALSLTLLGRFIEDAHGGDIRCIDRIDLHRADTATRADRHRTAWKVLAAYEAWLGPPAPAGGWAVRTWRRLTGSGRADPGVEAEALARHQTLAVLRLTGLFDRTATPGCLAALRAAPPIPGLTEALVGLDETDWRLLLSRLERARLIRLRPDAGGAPGLDAHPLIRDYFAEQLRRDRPAAFRGAHGRLFEYLCTSTPHRPDELEGLQPLYQAVRHGCLAGRQQEACDKVYRDRILRGTGGGTGVVGVNYSLFKFGGISADLSAVAAFFDEPWGRVSENLRDSDRAWLLHEAAFDLRARGRLTEALAPMRDSAEIAVRMHQWSAAAIRYANLSALEVCLGQLRDAVTDARFAVGYADHSGDAFHRMARRATVATAMHQLGERTEAGRFFEDAECMQREREPQRQLLYSLQGFNYCDWLLAPTERTIWRRLLADRCGQPVPEVVSPAIGSGAASDADASAVSTDLRAVCDEVERRAETALGIVLNGSQNLVDIALNHLTLARVRVLRTLLAGSLPLPGPQAEVAAAAVAAVRRAGRTDYLPRALLTAAWTSALRGDPDAARAALDEALRIAERGPMPLFEADCLLYRARLWHAHPWAPAAGAGYPWPDRTPRSDLAAARRLIEAHGYRRRLPELADAEAAMRAPGPATGG